MALSKGIVCRVMIESRGRANCEVDMNGLLLGVAAGLLGAEAEVAMYGLLPCAVEGLLLNVRSVGLARDKISRDP